jgi:HEPN domain-containing protein
MSPSLRQNDVKDDDVPRMHTIEIIVERFEDKLPVEISEETIRLFVRLSRCYLNNRYPEYRDKLSLQIKEAEANELCAQTKEAFAWLLTLKP